MTRLLLFLLLLCTLGACAAIEQGLQDQANPKHHPFPTYASGGGGNR